MEITWVFKERKRGQVEREGVEETKDLRVRERKRKKKKIKKGGLTDVFCHLQIPRYYGTFPWA